MTGPAHTSRLSLPAVAGALALLASLAACGDVQPTDVSARRAPLPPASTVQAFDCTASIASHAVSCSSAAESGGPSRALVGGQNTSVKLTSSNVNYDSGTGIFSFDVTVQNLMNEAIGTPDGVVADTDGIQVFFHNGPSVTGGTGSVAVANADGLGTFTASNQPYFRYSEILPKNAVSSAKNWQLQVTGSVTAFTFTLYLETDVQYLLVINEVLVNPAGTTYDTNGKGAWVEVYNAGTRRVQMEGLVFADSAASGRQPYRQISSALDVEPGGYVVLGQTTNTTTNGGVPVDFAWGGGVFLAHSLDAFKIARVYGTDTLTIDRTQYTQASVSAQDGISRELKNPALDNSNMDGSNWGNASVTAVYGPGGRGTPRAQNSDYTP